MIVMECCHLPWLVRLVCPLPIVDAKDDQRETQSHCLGFAYHLLMSSSKAISEAVIASCWAANKPQRRMRQKKTSPLASDMYSLPSIKKMSPTVMQFRNTTIAPGKLHSW